MKKFPILTVIAAGSLSATAMAQDERDENARAQPLAQSEENEEDETLQEVVCKTEKVTGSLTRVNRTCMTRQEWNLLSERTRREVNRIDYDANQAESVRGANPAGGRGPGGF